MEEPIQKKRSQDEAERELKQLSKLQGECNEWVEVSQILLSDLTVRTMKLQLTGIDVPPPVRLVPDLDRLVDEHSESAVPPQAKKPELSADTKLEHELHPSQKAHEQVEELRIDEVIDSDLRGSVLKLIGHDDHIIEQTLGEERVQLIGTSDLVLRHCTENAQQAFSALATVQVLQQELIAAEARAISAEERAMEAEEALQAAREKIYELERQLPQSRTETKERKNSALGIVKTEIAPEPKEVSPKRITSPKTSKSKKKQ